MKRLQKLVDVNSYLSDFRLSDYPDLEPINIVNTDDATGRLSRVSGDQLLIARPEAYDTGEDSDTYNETVVLAFFALAKINSSSLTAEIEEETYSRTLEILRAVLERIGDNLWDCSTLAGLKMTEVNVVPEYSIFGGWSGWSMEITFE